MIKKIWFFLPIIVVLALIIVFFNREKPASFSLQKSLNNNNLKPNVIFIMADDLGYGDLSSYGQKILSTPNIDRLAKEGIKFINHYSGSTVCAPARASLMTGKHIGHASVKGNQIGETLQDNELTVGNIFQEAGYTTGIIGKWGVGSPLPADNPLKHGFDYAYGYVNTIHAHNYFPPFLYRNGKKELLEANKQQIITDAKYLNYVPDKYRNSLADEGAGVAEVKAVYAHALLEEDALKFIEEHQNNPFFLYLPLTLPHANNESKPDGMEVPSYLEFVDKNWPNTEKGFAAMMKYLDESVGKILDKLDELNISQETMIMFTSDNGSHNEGGHNSNFFQSNGGLRGSKRDLYEGGIKVPFLVRWQGKIKPETISEHISSLYDFFPTISELVGVTANTKIDGISYLPILLGNSSKQLKHEYLYWEFSETKKQQALLQYPWKLIKFQQNWLNKSLELYDISKDVGESKNIASENPEIVKKMAKSIVEAQG